MILRVREGFEEGISKKGSSKRETALEGETLEKR